MLRTCGERLPDHLDLTLLIRTLIDLIPHVVELECPDRVHVPSQVARAIADATAEAVRNAVRHAGVRDLGAGVGRRSRCGGHGPVVVVVSDHGVGFDPVRVPTTRRGVRDSIHGRLAEIGGGVVLESAPGEGTTVRLRWPNA